MGAVIEVPGSGRAARPPGAARRFREALPSSRSVDRMQEEPLRWMTTPHM
ncbi:MAG: hypothetical protein JO116_06575 [Planctomycetaceae bacterium]|nr:hypothetical protein [Planctomycetaceae bacterium]